MLGEVGHPQLRGDLAEVGTRAGASVRFTGWCVRVCVGNILCIPRAFPGLELFVHSLWKTGQIHLENCINYKQLYSISVIIGVFFPKFKWMSLKYIYTIPCNTSTSLENHSNYIQKNSREKKWNRFFIAFTHFVGISYNQKKYNI